MIFLVTGRELNTDTPLAFIVDTETRNQAKSAIQRYCNEHNLTLSVYTHTHALLHFGEFMKPIRIDHLLPR
jgi:hypothetical protein